jgi:predicted LPLAT superfamily acyltransferase
MQRICALIPTYNHYKPLHGIIQKLTDYGLDILIVDDGSNQETQNILHSIAEQYPKVMLLRLDNNQGKGAACAAGLKYLYNRHYTHAFQIDADGQHDLCAIPDFLTIAKANPTALISGKPIYDQSIPLGRKIGRWFTHIWVFIETLSFRITDSMCGFRIYPLKETYSVLQLSHVGKRMDFDTEIMVRLFWNATPTLMIPVKVTYPKDNTSHFRLLQDNWLITKMHTRLVISMIFNIVSIIKHRPNYTLLNLSYDGISWASLEERGTLIGIFFISILYKLFGRALCQLIGWPLVLYYYITGTEQRNASQLFLKKIFKIQGCHQAPTYKDSLRHFMNFFNMALDKFSAWIGHSSVQDVTNNSVNSLKNMMSNKGGMILVSHLGNMEFCRAVSEIDHQKRLHILLHTKNAKRYNQMLHFFNPNVNINIIEVTDVGAETIIYLKDRVNKGDFVVIAADRFPVKGDKHVSYVPFLGDNAPFSQGPYILASLLECPVYTATAIKEEKKYHVTVDLFSEKIILDRKNKTEQLQTYANQYAHYLEKLALKYPYQWYNFFDFWQKL